MATQAVSAPTSTWRQTVRICVAWTLLAGYTVVLGVVIIVGERRTPYGDPVSYNAFVGPWAVPEWAMVLALASWLGTLFLVGLGPQPWRATRWAWFWVISMIPLLGPAGYLLLSGATWQWRPRRPEKRITGVVAFLLCLVAKSALGALAAAIL